MEARLRTMSLPADAGTEDRSNPFFAPSAAQSELQRPAFFEDSEHFGTLPDGKIQSMSRRFRRLEICLDAFVAISRDADIHYRSAILR